jgi:tRNA1(Val) A37 N6-methylase TrmN6
MELTWGAEGGLSRDSFLGGRISLWQPLRGYRAGADPVLLAASVTARPGQAVLDLGCGAGAAVLCLGARLPGLALHGLELQAEYARLAERNASDNGIGLTVHEGDVARPPQPLCAMQFDHVMLNPPYFDRQRGTPSADAGRDRALGGETPLDVWIDTATRRLAPGGSLWLVQRSARLPDVLRATDARLGGITVLPLAARRGRAADLFLMRARKGDKSPFRLLFPLCVHAGDRHGGTAGGDAPDFAPEIAAVLRDGAALEWTA